MTISASPHVALVTGANQGIGAATAVALGRRGAAVLVAYFRPGDDDGQPAEYNRLRRGDAADVVAEIERAGGRAHPVEADLRDPACPARLFDAAEERLGPPAIARAPIVSMVALLPCCASMATMLASGSGLEVQP